MVEVENRKRVDGDGRKSAGAKAGGVPDVIKRFFGRLTIDERVAALFLYRLAFADSMVCQNLAGTLAQAFESELGRARQEASACDGQDVVYLAGVLAGLNLADD